jgi:HSP20 family protein
MDDLWNRFFTGTPFTRLEAEEWLPIMDVSEKDGHIIVKADLPDFEAKDIDVTVSGDVLTIKGEKHKEAEKKEEHFHTRERYARSFQRSIRLPANVQPDRVNATLKNGVLTLDLPETEETAKKKIEIKPE